MDVYKFLKKLVDLEGSDLYVSAGIPPTVRVEGSTYAASKEEVTPAIARQMVETILDENQLHEFEKNLELNIALHEPKIGRFRVNVFKQRGEYAFVARHVKTDIPSMDALFLPTQLKDLIDEKRGLILVVGATGAGKSTTLASMISHRAARRSGHILSIEDPIEFIHKHHKSIINQREVGVDTHTYADALTNALREAPDVIMIGEIRDADTMRHALNYAETGHLCLATLHANNASQALDRIINFFPHDAHNQIRADISLFLKAIVAQNLCNGLDGKQIATFEIMMNTPHISDLILKGRVIDIKDAMDRSKEVGHRTFDDDLYGLWEKGRISQEEALRHAVSKNNLTVRFRSVSVKLPKTDQQKNKNVSVNANADFMKYATFRIRPPSVDGVNQRNQARALNKAILSAFEEKGLKYESKTPNVDIFYSFELLDDNGLRLEGVRNAHDKRKKQAVDARRQIKFSINVRDITNKQDVWRVMESALTAGDLEDQPTCDLTIATIVESYPAR